MTKAEELAHFQFAILASLLIRHSTFVLRHFTIRVHISRRSFSGGGFACPAVASGEGGWLTHEDSWNHGRPRP
jgi:hypothetical protein